MYFPLTIDSKRIITLPDGNKIVDLTHQTLSYKERDVTIFNTIYCSKEMVMRADYIAQLTYNDPGKTEYILKFNKISNPFSLNEGDSVMLPDSFNARNHFKVANKYEERRKRIRNQFIDKSKATTVDKNLSEFDERKKVNLPPNYAKEGDKEIIVANGIIKFGPYVSNKQKNANIQEDKMTKERREFLDRIKDLTK